MDGWGGGEGFMLCDVKEEEEMLEQVVKWMIARH